MTETVRRLNTLGIFLGRGFMTTTYSDAAAGWGGRCLCGEHTFCGDQKSYRPGDDVNWKYACISV